MGLFTKDIKTLDELFDHGLQDIYYAENQILKALPKLIEASTNPQLRRGLKDHLKNRGAGSAPGADIPDAGREAERHEVPWHQRSDQGRGRGHRQCRR